MQIVIEPHRGMVPLIYELPDGRKFIQFLRKSNFDETLDLPDGTIIVNMSDSSEVKANAKRPEREESTSNTLTGNPSGIKDKST
jgi:hypothetical protein